MIEVVIDFDEINISDKDKYTDIEYKLGRYLYNKLKIGPQDLPEEDPNGRGIVWDAFKDNLWDMMTKEIPKDYKYDPNDEWGWRDYHDYEIYVGIDRALGVKNENGTRDDIKLILRNFYPFYKKYKSIADDFLDIFLDVVNRSPKNSKESDDWYQMIMCIES